MTNNKRHDLLRQGDIVEILPPMEIESTLDDAGSLDSLPFMPEMSLLCGQRFQVARRTTKTCFDVPDGHLREFYNNDVVQLKEVRCSGSYHGGCDRECQFFWKEAWLRKVANDDAPSPTVNTSEIELLCAKLPTTSDTGKFVCQSSQLEFATSFLTRWKRLNKCVEEVSAGNQHLVEMVRLVMVGLAWKTYGKFFGKRPRGTSIRTPIAKLNLQPGELVRVKTFPQILTTLDGSGANRGLTFEMDMHPYCGKKYRVKRRLEKMIREGSGQMKEVANTVILEGIVCNCYFALGGCGRGETMYWREIWLERVNGAV